MKKIFTTLVALVALVLGLQAQKHNMYLHFADGTKKVYHVEDVDSVTFVEAKDYSNLKFDIQVSNISTNGVTTQVKANTADVLYYDQVFLKAALEEYTIEELAQAQLEYMYEEWVTFEDEYKAEYGDDITFANFFYPGNYVDTYTYSDLSPSTEYIVLAFGVDLELLEAIGTPDTVSFATSAPEPSDNQITFSLENDTLFIHTTNDDPYFWNAFLPEDLEEYGVETYTEAWDLLVEELDAIGYMEYFTSEGDEENPVESYFYGLPGTHTIVAAGWNSVRTTDFFTFEITLTEDQVGGGAELVIAKKPKAVPQQPAPAKKILQPAKHVKLVKK